MSISLLSNLSFVPLAFVDAETTGSSTAYGDRVTEVAILRVENGVVTDRYATLLNPLRRIAPAVVALTGITPEMVEDAPTFRDVAPDVADRLHDVVIVGHNVGFDLSFLRSEFRTAAMSLDDVADLRKTLDTVRLARRIFGRGGNGLQRLAARLEVVVDVAHRAMADCVTTAAVFERMLEPLGGGRLSLIDVLTLQGGPMKLASAAPAAAPLPVDLAEALAARCHVRMVYLDARNNRTERIVVPIQLTRLGDDRCLTAFCTLRQEQRSFKLARIVEITRIEIELAAEAMPDPLQCDEPFPEYDAADEPIRNTRQSEASPDVLPIVFTDAPRPEVDPDARADRPARDDPRYVPEPEAGPRL